MDNQNLNEFNAYTDPAATVQQPDTQPVAAMGQQATEYAQPVSNVSQEAMAYTQPAMDGSQQSAQPVYGAQPANNMQDTYNAQATYNEQPAYGAQQTYNAQSAYNAQPSYNAQPAYDAQPSYNTQSAYDAQNAYGVQPTYNTQNAYASQNMNTAYYNYGTGYGYPENHVNQLIRCPGKEITCLVLGINSLVWGVLTICFCWYVIIAIVYGLFAIGCGIAALVLNKKVLEIATVTTKKVHTGKKLAIAGIICACAAAALAIVIVIFLVVIGVGSSLFSIYQYGY